MRVSVSMTSLIEDTRVVDALSRHPLNQIREQSRNGRIDIRDCRQHQAVFAVPVAPLALAGPRVGYHRREIVVQLHAADKTSYITMPRA